MKGAVTPEEANLCLDRLMVYGRYHHRIPEDARRRLEGERHG